MRNILPKEESCFACITRELFSGGGKDGLVSICTTGAAPARIDAQPLDLLIERGKRNLKQFRCFGLIPACTFEHVANNAALDFIHNLK